MPSESFEEAWALIQETFNAYRASGTPLMAPVLAPHIERMIEGYKEHDQEEEAWALTQETFNAYRASGTPLMAPVLAPHIERMIEEEEWEILSDGASTVKQGD
ncbi:hypothetical protein VE03_10788 [Pseudogymnoascus sp. 23342-1-I1]|nr:hypothetical protein VE03_10788 [Pseudogymnoascus sp. 23342-1-I1]